MVAGHSSLFGLVDVNNFYVSCERVFNPKLIGRPVVVLSNNDGCAVARSNEVKALGVPMAAPWFQLKELAVKHGIVALSSNYTLYADMSDRAVQILRQFCPQLEVYSIDESFLMLDDMAGLWPDFTELGCEIRHRIKQWVGLPVCAGFGASKTLAKLANHIAKKRPEFAGVCDLTRMSAPVVDQLMASIEVGEVWGIGRRIGVKLGEMGIRTVYDLRHAPEKTLRQKFGVVVERTCAELQGISCIELEEIAPPRKQIVSSRSFGARVTALREIEESISMYMARAAEKLRGQGSMAGAVHVFVQTDRFRPEEPQYNNGITVPLPEPSDDLRVLTRAALWGLRRIYRAGFKYKKTGVMLMDLLEGGIVQETLFDPGIQRRNSSEVMAVLDRLNMRYGRDTVRLGAAAGVGRWAARFDNVTPHYTTDWEQLPIAR